MWLKMDLQELNVFSGSRPFFHVSIPSEPSNGWSLAVIHSSHNSSFPASRTQILFRLYCSDYLLECSRSHSDSYHVAFDSFPFSCFNLRLWFPLLRPMLPVEPHGLGLSSLFLCRVLPPAALVFHPQGYKWGLFTAIFYCAACSVTKLCCQLFWKSVFLLNRDSLYSVNCLVSWSLGIYFKERSHTTYSSLAHLSSKSFSVTTWETGIKVSKKKLFDIRIWFLVKGNRDIGTGSIWEVSCIPVLHSRKLFVFVQKSTV